MKKLLMLSIGILSSSYILAQDITDAVRYSKDDIQGTARFKAMGGAFGALGGDMSAVNINPAGSAIFNKSHASFSLGGFNKDNTISYFNGGNSASNTNIDLNQLGATFVFDNMNSNSPWKNFTIGVAYDQTANFDDEWLANGTNPNNTIGNYFLNNAEGLRLDEISALPGESISQAYSEIGSIYGVRNQQAFLGYEGFIFDPVSDTDDNTSYTSNIGGGNYNQRYAYASSGYNGKLAFNLSTSYDDKFYFGLNLNSHFINYERSTFLEESNSNAASTVTNVDFENNLLTTGSGFSFQLGGIAKLTNELRLGLSYNSPTWYRISDETSQYLGTTVRDGGGGADYIPVNPNVVNIYEEYKLQTPSKLTGSLAYVFGKKGLISFDYSVKDYSNTKFKPTSDMYFSSLNTDITNSLDTAASYRFGGEYRYKQISFRGGYRIEESPYKDDNFYGDLTGYSLGLGYNFGNLTLDLAFSQAERDINHQLYSVGLTDAVSVDSKYTDVILTLGFSL
ncbi:OmpP1/FadL family transporter [Winogradskyella vidalii]|uniref:OmpP1/FadL family transporter n=1 Tax=Winogradskyella vidalii TaxID=2615024 RepID=UPI0015C9A77C|nr:outer membrane protein transport protein [Winogradskyella vidalii]